MENRERQAQARRDKGTRRSRWVPLLCSGCGAGFERRVSDVKDQAYVFCSRECYRRHGSHLKHGGGRPGRPRADYWCEGLPDVQPETVQAVERYGPPSGWTIDHGYVVFLWRDHPASAGNGRIGEHRVVAYEHVGDAIRGHHVDHVNNQPQDNRWENLQVLTREEHGRKTHAADGVGYAARFLAWAREHHPDVVSAFDG